MDYRDPSGKLLSLLFMHDIYPSNRRGNYKIEMLVMGNHKYFSLTRKKSYYLTFDDVLFIQGLQPDLTSVYNPFNHEYISRFEPIIPVNPPLVLYNSCHMQDYIKPNKIYWSHLESQINLKVYTGLTVGNETIDVLSSNSTTVHSANHMWVKATRYYILLTAKPLTGGYRGS